MEEIHGSSKQVYRKQWVNTENRIVQLQVKYRHSNMAVCQLPTCTAMDVAVCQWL